jgi:ABC-type branched-subunit amino acid transport system ATPase component
MGLRLLSFSGSWEPHQSLYGFKNRGVTLETVDDEWIYVAGGNGVGKSTLLSAVAGLTPYVSGKCQLDGSDVTLDDPYVAFRRGIQIVPQTERLPSREPLSAANSLSFWNRPALYNEAAINNLYTEVQHTGLFEKDRMLEPRVFDLVAAILSAPRVLLLDEPVPKLLDEASKENTLSLYSKLKSLLPGTIVLFTDHHVGIGMKVCDRVLWLESGNKPSYEVFASVDPKAKKLIEKLGSQTGNTSDKGELHLVEAEEQLSRIVRPNRSIISQINLAVRATHGSSGVSKQKLVKILEDFPFLQSVSPAGTLSGGQRIILAWFLLEYTGLGTMPKELLRHIDNENYSKLRRWATNTSADLPERAE